MSKKEPQAYQFYLIIKLMSWRQNLNLSNLSPQDFTNYNKIPPTQSNPPTTKHAQFSFLSTKQIPRNFSSDVLRGSLQQPKSPINFRSPNPSGKSLFPIHTKPRPLIKNIILDFQFKDSVPKARKKIINRQQDKFTEQLTKFPVFNIGNLKLRQKNTLPTKSALDSVEAVGKTDNKAQKVMAFQNTSLTPTKPKKQKIIQDLKQQLKKQLFKYDLNFESFNSQIKIDANKSPTNKSPIDRVQKSVPFPFQRMAPLNEKYEAPKKEDFEIGKTLGKGQYGQVMVVRHKKTGFLCAMKVMSKKVIREQNYINQIVRELSIQSYLRHRNIAPLYGYFSDSQNVYLLVQFCEGGQLYNRIKKRKRMEEKQTSEITKQILEGLDYIHKQQIIHRDLKPQNILFASDVVKISDFGWAVFSNAGFRRTVSGSPLYYPPEIVKGEQYDEKIDLWNVGMMVYECLLGKIPFRIYSELDLDKIVSEEITFPDYIDVSEVAKDFIVNSMRKNPEQRMQIREMLRHQFIRQYDSSSNCAQVEADLNKVLR